MPSETFFNLPEEKREKILDAATEEFARVPYEKASINRMIKDAGIPRGSFYMYFADKEDLFDHLMQGPLERLSGDMGKTLKKRNGDVFRTILDFFDQAMTSLPSGNPVLEKIGAVFMRNPTLGQAYLVRGKDVIFQRLADNIDRERLDLREAGDLDIMLEVLVSTLANALGDVMRTRNVLKTREHLETTLAILRRGMEKKEGGA